MGAIIELILQSPVFRNIERLDQTVGTSFRLKHIRTTESWAVLSDIGRMCRDEHYIRLLEAF